MVLLYGAMTFGAGAGAVAGASSIAKIGLLGGATMTVASNIGNTIGQFNKASLLPNISGGQPTGDIIWACDRNLFSFRKMRVKTEYLKIIDDYFTKFRLCDTKTRNAKHNWTHILELYRNRK